MQLAQHQSNAPRDLRRLLIKLFRELFDGEGDGEEIKGIPGPGKEGDEEEQPLLKVQQTNELDRIRRLDHGWLEGGDSGCQIGGHAHVFLMCHLELGRIIADLLISLLVRHCEIVESGIEDEASEDRRLRVETKRRERRNIMILLSSRLR